MDLEEVLSAINETRLLVFLECNSEKSECEEEDFGKINPKHHFHQVRLTARQFKKMSDAVITKETPDPTLKDGYNMAELRLGGTFDATPFEGLSSHID